MKVTIKVERDEPKVAQETYIIEHADGARFHVFSTRHGDHVLTDVSIESAMRGVAELVAETGDGTGA